MADTRASRGMRGWWPGHLLAVLVAVGAAMSATPLTASDMGFKLRVDIISDPSPQLFWLSIPYRYTPEDVGTQGTVDAEDFCQDLSSGGVSAVVRWDEPSSTFVEHPCGGGMPFALTVGTGYGVRVTAGWSINSNIAGSHDDGFAYSIPPSGDGQLSWLSVPYHLRVPEHGFNLPVSAEDLCRQIGSSEVLAIVRWDGPTGAYQAYGCGSVFEAPFEVVRGRAYGMVNRTGQTIDWQPIHF